MWREAVELAASKVLKLIHAFLTDHSVGQSIDRGLHEIRAILMNDVSHDFQLREGGKKSL